MVRLCLILLFITTQSQANTCEQALSYISNCLALQSDFNDKLSLKKDYDATADCIQGVNFYKGILSDDAKFLQKDYHVQVQSKIDPLERKAERGPQDTIIQYCAGEISLLVKEQPKELSLVFKVATNKSKIQSLAIEF